MIFPLRKSAGKPKAVKFDQEIEKVTFAHAKFKDKTSKGLKIREESRGTNPEKPPEDETKELTW